MDDKQNDTFCVSPPDGFKDECIATIATGQLCSFTLECEESVPRTFRVAIKPCGSVELQGGYLYQSGLDAGYRWRSLPTVYIDENGNEIDQPV